MGMGMGMGCILVLNENDCHLMDAWCCWQGMGRQAALHLLSAADGRGDAEREPALEQGCGASDSAGLESGT